jgi:predicted O-methyltransferase YrrM
MMTKSSRLAFSASARITSLSKAFKRQPNVTISGPLPTGRNIGETHTTFQFWKRITMSDPKTGAVCSLHDPLVVQVLDRLHTEADSQRLAFVPVGIGLAVDWLLGRNPSTTEMADRMKDLYIPITREQGQFVYLVARAVGARRVVEFGTSLAISTIYEAAAVRDNGGGLVIGSEIEPSKLSRAQANVDEARLTSYVEIRPGDALETLRDSGGPVDLVLLDGWKDLYVPVLEILAPQLRSGAIVLADNIHTFPRALAPYLEWVRDISNGFQSVTLPLGHGTEFSVRL